MNRSNSVNYKNKNMPLEKFGEDKYYRDFYKVIVDNETRSEWTSVIKQLKREFINFPDLIEWFPSFSLLF